MDLFGERVAGGALEGPGGGAGGVVVKGERGLQVRAGDVAGAGGVVVEGERGGQVLRADLSLAVGEGVDEREADRVRFGAGGDLADDPGRGVGELSVGVVPELTGVAVEA